MAWHPAIGLEVRVMFRSFVPHTWSLEWFGPQNNARHEVPRAAVHCGKCGRMGHRWCKGKSRAARHGTVSEYNKHACRCGACRAAWAAYKHERRVAA